jgi:rhodanese-related sulfurtransferase
MRNKMFFIILIILVAVIAVVTYQLSANSMEQSSVAQAVQDMAEGKAALIDVRRDDEWATGHAKGAMHFELATLEAGEMPDISKDATVYVYCAAGARAGKAKDILTANGWTNVTNIGGFDDWKNAGGSAE